MTHVLKIDHQYFIPVLNGNKKFEIRLNDRNFQIGDTVILRELTEDKENFSGREIKTKIIYITDFEQKENYIVFGFE